MKMRRHSAGIVKPPKVNGRAAALAAAESLLEGVMVFLAIIL
jgi:hypothetical protein